MKALLLTFVMPPGGMLTLILIGLLLSLRRGRRRVAMTLIWIGAIGLYVLAMPLVSQSLLLALERDLPIQTPVRQPPAHPPGAIIILGGERIASAGGALEARPGPLTMERLQAGAALARRTGLPILVTGGEPRPGAVPLGTLMAESLKSDFNTPARWVEDKSEDTWQNARFSAAILRRDGIDSVYVVTSAWHMRRSLLAFRDSGLFVTAAPVPLDAPLEPNIGDFMPHVSAWLVSYYALH